MEHIFDHKSFIEMFFNIGVIHISFAWSKWNTDDGINFHLTCRFSTSITNQICTTFLKWTRFFYLTMACTLTLPRNELLCQLFEFHIKWRFGTHGSWKKSKSWGQFWSYQLNSTANSARFARFLGKWAKLVLILIDLLCSVGDACCSGIPFGI